jgi:SAM-dependent methyltransferase
VEEWRYRELYELEERHWWFRSRRRVVAALLARAGATTGSPRILDAGCGTGRNLVDYARLGPAEGVDASPEAVAFCHRRGLTEVRESPLETLPFPDGRFDLIVATDVIEHLDDDRRALAELRRVAAPGGRLVLTVPAYGWLWSVHDVSMHHRRRYTLGRLRAAVGATGWRTELGTYFFSALLPGAAAVRLGRRALGREESGSDLELGPRSLNRALELPSHAEARLIARGGRLPAGLSVGLVAAAG